MNPTFKSHLLGMRHILHYYFMGVAVSWAGFPFVCFISNSLNWHVDKIQIYYSIFATISYAIITYLGIHDWGESERRPYKWARYKMKGAVSALMAFFCIYALEAFFIFIAERYAVVQHPILNITGVHGYVTQFVYMPFFWLYKLLDYRQIIPSVTYLTALIPGVFVVAVNAFAYWMGYTEKVLLKHKPKGKLAQVLFYGRKRKKKKNEQKYSS